MDGWLFLGLAIPSPAGGPHPGHHVHRDGEDDDDPDDERQEEDACRIEGQRGHWLANAPPRAIPNRFGAPTRGYPEANDAKEGDAMPAGREKIPSTIERSSKKVQRTYREALESAHEQYDSEERAHKVAWAAVKGVARKEDDRWVLK